MAKKSERKTTGVPAQHGRDVLVRGTLLAAFVVMTLGGTAWAAGANVTGADGVTVPEKSKVTVVAKATEEKTNPAEEEINLAAWGEVVSVKNALMTTAAGRENVGGSYKPVAIYSWSGQFIAGRGTCCGSSDGYSLFSCQQFI